MIDESREPSREGRVFTFGPYAHCGRIWMLTGGGGGSEGERAADREGVQSLCSLPVVLMFYQGSSQHYRQRGEKTLKPVLWGAVCYTGWLSFSRLYYVQKSKCWCFQCSSSPPAAAPPPLSFCYLPCIYFIWHLSARFLKLLTNNLPFTFCWHRGLPVNALCMFLGSCVIAGTLVYCAICSVTNGLIRTWKIYKQFNRSN